MLVLDMIHWNSIRHSRVGGNLVQLIDTAEY